MSAAKQIPKVIYDTELDYDDVTLCIAISRAFTSYIFTRQ